MAKSKSGLPAIRRGSKKNGGNPNPLPPPVETRFKPGQSGNPSGRPKGAIVLSKAYYNMLAQLVPNDPQGRTYAELVASGQIIAAAKGQTPAAAEIRKATEGDVVRLMNMTDDELIKYITDAGQTDSGGPVETDGQANTGSVPESDTASHPDSSGA